MGYLPVAFDGKYFVARGEQVQVPPKIGRHRPDALGINITSKALCIGEAKTAGDMLSERTREQLSDFASILGASSGQRFDLIIGIPKNEEKALQKLMADLGLNGLPNVTYIMLPEELVEDA